MFAFVQPLNIEQYTSLRRMASDIHAYAPDARILTTYYCGEHQISLHHMYLFQWDVVPDSYMSISVSSVALWIEEIYLLTRIVLYLFGWWTYCAIFHKPNMRGQIELWSWNKKHIFCCQPTLNHMISCWLESICCHI